MIILLLSFDILSSLLTFKFKIIEKNHGVYKRKLVKKIYVLVLKNCQEHKYLVILWNMSNIGDGKKNPLCHGLCRSFQNQISSLSGSPAPADSMWKSHVQTKLPLKCKNKSLFQHKASRLWDAGNLCSSKMWVIFLLIHKLRRNFSDLNFCIVDMLINAVELSTL